MKAVGPAGKTITHEYGPKGRRVATHSSVAGRTEYLYEGDEPIADYDGNDNLLRQYVNGAGIDERLLYIQYDANGDEELRQYYHANHQGTIIAMSNGGQLTPAKKYTYDSYGVPGEPEDGQPVTLRPFGCSRPLRDPLHWPPVGQCSRSRREHGIASATSE